MQNYIVYSCHPHTTHTPTHTHTHTQEMSLCFVKRSLACSPVITNEYCVREIISCHIHTNHTLSLSPHTHTHTPHTPHTHTHTLSHTHHHTHTTTPEYDLPGSRSKLKPHEMMMMMIFQNIHSDETVTLYLIIHIKADLCEYDHRVMMFDWISHLKHCFLSSDSRGHSEFTTQWFWWFSRLFQSVPQSYSRISHIHVRSSPVCHTCVQVSFFYFAHSCFLFSFPIIFPPLVNYHAHSLIRSHLFVFSLMPCIYVSLKHKSSHK